MTRPSVMLVDDHALLLAGLCRVLESDFEVVGAFPDGESALAAVPDLAPDAVLLDISMPGLNGIETARRLKELSPAPKVVFVTRYGDPEHVSEARRAGASGYVDKRCAPAELVEIIWQVLRGDGYATALAKPDAAGVPDGGLTLRQREVLRLIAEGRTARQIAACLAISVKTVEFHRAGIVQRLGIRTSAELTRYAIGQGLVPL